MPLCMSVYKESASQGWREMNISQSAVHEQVKLLEEESGSSLFRRTSRGIESTDAAEPRTNRTVIGDLLSLSIPPGGCVRLRCRTRDDRDGGDRSKLVG